MVECCRKEVGEILVRQQDFDALKVTWCPSLMVILRILLNYGTTTFAYSLTRCNMLLIIGKYFYSRPKSMKVGVIVE